MTTTPAPTARRAGRFRKVLAAVLATVATSATVIPLMATPAAAASTSVSFRNCSTMTVGSTLTCTVRVTHSASNDPTGTVTFSLSNLADSEVRTANSRCTLVGQSGGNRSDCSVQITAWSTGSLTVAASYASSNTSSFSNSSGSTTVTVAEPSSFGIAVSLKSLRDLALGSSSSAEAGSSSEAVTFDVKGYACDAGTNGYELVTGAASGTPSDPTTVASPTVLGPFTTSNGDFTHSVTIPTDHPTGVFRGAYVCASSKPTRGSSSSISSTGPVMQMTISGTSGSTFSAFSRSSADGRFVLGTATADDPDDGADGLKVELSVDQDDLNPVDKVNIVKEGADALKARVDALVPAASTVSRVGYTLVEDGLDRATAEKWTAEVAAGRADSTAVANALAGLPAAAPLMSAPSNEFVQGVYTRALGRTPTADEAAAAVAALATGRISRPGLVALSASSDEAVRRWRHRSYVAAAFQALTAKVPTDGELGRYVGELDGGGYKVNTVEGIALLGASAAAWNVAAPAGRTPASATFTAPAPAPAAAPVAVRPPVAAPAPPAVAPAAPKATSAQRPQVRSSRTAKVRKPAVRRAPARKVVSKRTATVRRSSVRPAPTRKVVAKRTAEVRKVRR